jgi:glycosyltransferase involved in cell wall biosynthesis
MAIDSTRRRILIISQVYVPDPASVGQHMADAAESLAARGHRVTVLASARGYDDPSVKYPARERRGGVDIVRLPWSSFGKRTILIRLVGQSIFLLQAVLRGLLTPGLSAVFASTSPPLCSAVALAIHFLRRVPLMYWWMDLNPDQLIAYGQITERSLSARVFNWLNRCVLRRASEVIVLDRFMADRLTQKLDVREKFSILPPWPHVDVVDAVPKTENPFVREHGLAQKFVVMYSGNHSIASPLTTLIEAALRLQDHPRLYFMFIGGGLGKQEVEQAIERFRPANMVSLPYQPLEQLHFSLSAADVHVVALGNEMVGIIHPCKIYGAMAVGRPILYIGPRPSHISDLLEKYDIGWHVSHGDVDGAVQVLREIADARAGELSQLGERAQDAVRHELSKEILAGRFCDVIESGLRAAGNQRAKRWATAHTTTTD